MPSVVNSLTQAQGWEKSTIEVSIKSLTYGHFWGTHDHPFGRESGVVRSKRGFYI